MGLTASYAFDGSMSEWLGTGLQNRSQRFESAWNLQPSRFMEGFFMSKHTICGMFFV